MIGPKAPRPSKADENRAYQTCTERDYECCVRCGFAGVTHRDHRQNRQAGNTVVSNLQLLCAPHDGLPGCHLWKTENPSAAVLEGFAVPSYARWERWPAWREDIRSWVLYLNEPNESDGLWWTVLNESTADMLMGRTETADV